MDADSIVNIFSSCLDIFIAIYVSKSSNIP